MRHRVKNYIPRGKPNRNRLRLVLFMSFDYNVFPIGVCCCQHECPSLPIRILFGITKQTSHGAEVTGPGFESGISHNDPDELQDDCVIK